MKLEIGKEVKIRLKRMGMYQIITFTVVAEKMPIGSVRMLKTDRKIDTSEITRIAEEYQIPVKDRDGIAVPSGKKLVDFLVA